MYLPNIYNKEYIGDAVCLDFVINIKVGTYRYK